MKTTQKDSPTDHRLGVVVTLVTILLGHVCVDALAALMPSTLGVLEVRLGLASEQAAWLLGLGSLTSGLAQPVCAWLSDHFGSRILGTMGIALAAVGIGSLGFADSLVSVAAIYACGMIGVGMFHPIGAATIGLLRSHRRTSAVSIFFVAGMTGGVLGALIWPRFLSTTANFDRLPWIIAPVLCVAAVLHYRFSALSSNSGRHDVATIVAPTHSNWAMVGLLFVSAALRFCVNLALTYLFVRWVQSEYRSANPNWTAEEIASLSAPVIGNLNASMLLGMAIGGLLAGALVRSGRERLPMILVPILFAPVIGLFPFAPIEVGYVLAIAAGIGFASMIPVTISLAQQLLPHRTNLASGLMMGGAWAVAMIGPWLADRGVAQIGIAGTFYLTAAVLAVAGLLCLPLNMLRSRVA